MKLAELFFKLIRIAIDVVGFQIRRHTFKMAAMTSSSRLQLHTSAGCPRSRRARVTSLA